jgi:methionine-rich copper-binding protein CopC
MTTITSAGRVRHRPRALLAAATALGIVLAATTAIAPASAHDELVSSTPASDAALDPAPTEVVLTYSDNILEVGVEVSVTDADGAEWVADAPVVDGPTVTVPLESDMPGGAYTAEWRVVSSDGHPISGTIPFTVTTPAASPSPSASEPAVTSPTDAVTSAPSASAEPVASDDPGLSGAHIAIIAGIILALVIIVAGVLLVLARRRTHAPGADRGDDTP